MLDLLIPLMFATMAAMLLLGAPVSLSLIVHGFAFTLLGAWIGYYPPELVQAHMLRVYGLLFNEVLLAIPLFTLMGLFLERSGIAEDMLHATAKLLQAIRGGLAISVVIVGTILAATTGVVQASIVAMGLIALPAMLRRGYQAGMSAGVIAASGTLAQLIPPSLVLIVIADATGIPIFRMYERALVPGLLLASLYIAYVVLRAWLQPSIAPPVLQAPAWADAWRGLRSLLAPMLIVAATMGPVLAGVATPTESGGFGAASSMLLAAGRRRLSRAMLRQVADATTLISCCALFIVIGASFFTLPFNALDGKLWMTDVFSHLPGGEGGFLIAATLLIFVLAFFLDFFEIAFLALPLLMPVVNGLGIDPAWFAVLVCVALQTSFMHPPFGVAIYTLRSVAPPTVSSKAIYWGAVPFIVLQLGVALLLVAFPQLALDLGAKEGAVLSTHEAEQLLHALPSSRTHGPNNAAY